MRLVLMLALIACAGVAAAAEPLTPTPTECATQFLASALAHRGETLPVPTGCERIGMNIPVPPYEIRQSAAGMEVWDGTGLVARVARPVEAPPQAAPVPVKLTVIDKRPQRTAESLPAQHEYHRGGALFVERYIAAPEGPPKQKGEQR